MEGLGSRCSVIENLIQTRTSKGPKLKNGLLKLDPSKDSLLTDFGKIAMKNQYLQNGESIQELFERVASTYGDREGGRLHPDQENFFLCAQQYADSDSHSQRLYNYMSRHWFMPATPVLGNAGLGGPSEMKQFSSLRLPISCYLNEAGESLEDIARLLNENIFLSASGGGIGSFWSDIKPASPNSTHNVSAGVIPFLKIMETMSLAISQGLRRGASAAYMDISHPEVLEFIELRRPTGGDPHRKALNLHHGVIISDNFMLAVQEDQVWDLVDPDNKQVMRSVPARELWIKILTTRVETGEPYIIFKDNVNKVLPDYQKEQNLWVKTSNLCTEIFLPTGIDYQGRRRTAVCCLSSLNLYYFLEWQDHPTFIEDCMRFLDNVLSDFIARAPAVLKDAAYASSQGRPVGLGVMGFHSFLQKQRVSLESVVAGVWNRRIFSHIHEKVNKASQTLAIERGSCPDAARAGVCERFTHKMAIAPTASISIVAGGVSPGIEPLVANAYTHKTLSGSFLVKNTELIKLLDSKEINTPEVWHSILANKGSVHHLHQLSDLEKSVFKTAFEIDQKHLVRLASERQQWIDQGQSLNLFLWADTHKRTLHDYHWMAWKEGIKSMYYLRSASLQRPEGSVVPFETTLFQENDNSYEECLSCQ